MQPAVGCAFEGMPHQLTNAAGFCPALQAMARLMEGERQRRTFVGERQAVRERLRKEMEQRRRSSFTLGSAAAAAALAKYQQQQQQGEGDPVAEAEQRAEAAYLQLEDEWRAKLGLPPRGPPATDPNDPASTPVAAAAATAAVV